jgi:hypothetical protein
VLAVHGGAASPTSCAATRELARRDEALLVRERERDTLLERPERRPDAGEPDDRVEDDVGLAALEQLERIAADLRVLDAVFLGSASSGVEPDWSAQSSSSDARRRPRSPGGRSSPWRRAARRVARRKDA